MSTEANKIVVRRLIEEVWNTGDYHSLPEQMPGSYSLRRTDMTRFTFAGLVLLALLLAVPIASAEDGWPGCPWGAAYDEMVHGYVAECFTATTASESIAPKAAGRAAPALAVIPEQGCPRGIQDDLTGHRCVMGYVNGPAATESIAPKIAGLEAPATTTEQGWPGCPRGIQDDLTGRGCVTSYVNAPAATESIAPKAAGLAAPAQAVAPEQDRHASAPGFFYVVGSGDQRDCFLESDWTVSAPWKPAELAQSGCCGEPPGAWEEVSPKPAKLAQSGCCGEPPGAWEEVQPKPAELAQSGWTGCPWGYGFNPMIHGDVLECLDRPAPATQTASKPAGLAAPAPAPAQFGPCGSSGESPDPSAWPDACLH